MYLNAINIGNKSISYMLILTKVNKFESGKEKKGKLCAMKIKQN